MIVDSHCHIYSDEFKEDLDQVIERARQAGVQQFLMPNVDAASIELMHRVADRYPYHAHPMIGLHPCSVKDDAEIQLAVMEKHLFLPIRKYIAVGEIGIDLYWDKTTLALQIEAFERQIGWAKTLNLPIVIHVREAFDEVFEVIDRMHDERLKGVFHCFSGNWEQAQHILAYQTFKLGIGGVVTFKNGGLDKFIHRVDPQNILIETDSPYLTPVPHRGKRNEPAFAKLVVQKLAECYQISVAEIEQITTRNCEDLFGMAFNEPFVDPLFHPVIIE